MNIKLILYGIVVAAIIGIGLYGRHIYNEAKRVPALVSTINILEDQRKAERESAQRALEQEASIRKQLASVDARSALLARRLRSALQSVPKAPSSPSGPVGTSGDGSGSGEAGVDVIGGINNALAACQRDAIRLMQWQTYYESIPPELK